MAETYLPVFEMGITFRNQSELYDGRTIYPYYCFQIKDHCFVIRSDTGFSSFLSSWQEQRLHNGLISSYELYCMGKSGLAEESTYIQKGCSAIAPSFFLIDISTDCNFNCIYCFRKHKCANKYIDEAYLTRICAYIVQYCKTHHMSRITIQPWGGEPLLQVDRILYIRRYFNDNSDIDVNIFVETNGSLLTHEIAEKLFENQIRLSFSFDGLPEIHNVHRKDKSGQNTADRVVNGINNAKYAGYRDIHAICVLSKLCLGKIKDIVDYSIVELGLTGIRLNPVHIPYQGITNTSLICSCEDWTQIFHEIADVSIHLYQQGSPFHELNTWERINNIIGYHRTSVCRSQGCCGGKKMISFSMEGDIFPCELTDWPEYCIGNIDDQKDLIIMVKETISGSNNYFSRKWKTKCASCPWWSFCRGGCAAALIYRNRLGKGVDEQECLYNKVIYNRIVQFILSQDVIVKKLETQSWNSTYL